jgi:plastocyanin
MTDSLPHTVARSLLRRMALTGTLLAAGVGAAAGAACFSERSDGTGPDPEGECSFGLTPGLSGSTIVVVRGFAFQPQEVRVRPGERVTWVNCEPTGTESHTSTADAGAWNSPLLAPGQTFTQTMAAAGTYAYHCEPHPAMVGRVVVE